MPSIIQMVALFNAQKYFKTILYEYIEYLLLFLLISVLQCHGFFFVYIVNKYIIWHSLV